MRADAQRNRDRLLDAAVELILDLGVEPPLDAVARRAGVGIGTLYRHFPGRDDLLHAVAQHTLSKSIDAADSALATAPDAFEALRRYMHDAVSLGVGVLNLVRPLLDDPDWTGSRARIGALLDTMLERAKHEGRLRRETTAADVVFAVIRFSRPVVAGLERSDERELAHRHLDIYIDGLGTAAPTDHRLPDPPVLRRWAG